MAPTATPEQSEMPVLGLGTWENTDPDQCAASVRTALEMGYRHIDTAQAYGNEAAVGAGLDAADVDREEVFLATKVWIDDLDPEGVRESTEASLDRLGVDSVDLLYVHWPARTYDPAATLEAFDDLVERGLTGRVGISNFEPHQVDEALEAADSPIFANQIEVHPFLPQYDLVDHCRERGVEVVAYSPLARGDVLSDPTLESIAEKHDATPAQVTLAWLRDREITTIPKATSEGHIVDNWASLDLDLDDEDHERIAAIEERGRRVDPGFAPWT